MSERECETATIDSTKRYTNSETCLFHGMFDNKLIPNMGSSGLHVPANAQPVRLVYSADFSHRLTDLEITYGIIYFLNADKNSSGTIHVIYQRNSNGFPHSFVYLKTQVPILFMRFTLTRCQTSICN